jgi:hypothetical protein
MKYLFLSMLKLKLNMSLITIFSRLISQILEIRSMHYFRLNNTGQSLLPDVLIREP